MRHAVSIEENREHRVPCFLRGAISKTGRRNLTMLKKRLDRKGRFRQTARLATALILVISLISAVLTPSQAAGETSFSDVPATSWCAAAVSYASANGIAYGSGGRFRPNDAVTRGEFVVMLAGVLAPGLSASNLPENPFTDVPEDSFYRNAAVWAYSEGLVSGTSDGCFSPKSSIKRQDMALILCKAQMLASLGTLPMTTPEKSFVDQDQISGYATDAVMQLQRQGLLTGDPEGRCNPKKSLTRAQAATVLMRVHMFKTGHTHSYKKAEAVYHSCTGKGTQYYRCDCGSFYGKKELAPRGHNYTSRNDYETWTVVYTCSRCGNSYSERLPYQTIYKGNSLISYDTALSYVDRLHTIYPDLINSYVGGKSYLGTDIRVVTLGKGSRYIFMNANIHALETVTTNYLLKVLDEYAYAYVTDGSIGSYRIKPLLDSFTIVMIPCSNPDGRAKVLAGTETSMNARGVNLNANFPTNWVYDESGESGSAAGSEPETKVILGVLQKYPFELVLDCHTSGNVIYYADPDCSNALTSQSYQLASAMKAESGFGLYTYRASAGLANYARHPMGIPGLTVEMYPYTNGTIDCTKFTEWCWSKLNTMPAIAMNWLK